jgi:flagellar basal body-associated protein FliL
MDESNHTNYTNTSQSNHNDSPKGNRKRLIIFIFATLVIIVAFAFTLYVLFGKSAENLDSQNVTPVVSEEDLQQNLTELDITAQDAQSATSDLVDTLDSYGKQLKVGE